MAHITGQELVEALDIENTRPEAHVGRILALLGLVAMGSEKMTPIISIILAELATLAVHAVCDKDEVNALSSKYSMAIADALDRHTTGDASVH